jgi:CRISPR-associated protein Cmr1
LNTGLDTSYAWFGLIKRSPLPDRTGIKASLAESTNNPESARQLLIAMPDNASPLIEEAMRLMNAFGTIGSRSRGGWGSLLVTERSAELKSIDWQRYSQGLNHCLSRDWAAALASDAQGPCVWESTSGYESWDKAMKVIATERKNLRSSLKLPSKDLRSALGFATPGRMPSPSRWKLFAREDGKLGIRTFAMPHRLPSDSKKQMTEADLERAWGLVIQTLDSSKTFSPRQKGART